MHQISLLKEGKDLPDELQQKLQTAEEKANRAVDEPRTSTPASTPSKPQADSEDVKNLKDKVCS